MTRMTPLAALCCLPAIVSAADSPFSINLDAGVLYDDNVARGILPSDIYSDTIYNLALSARYSTHLSEHSLLTTSAGIETYQYTDFDKLSSNQVFVRADYELQPGHGYTAAWYLVSLEYGVADYESSLRDSDFITLELSTGKRMTDRISLRTGLVFQRFSADTDAFDADNSRFYVSMDYKTSQSNTVYTTLAYTDGESATSTRDQTPANKTSSAPSFAHHLPSDLGVTLRIDDAFRNGFVYKLDTESLSLQLGDNYSLSNHQSLDASIFYYDTEGIDDASYDGIILQLSYLHRFE